MNVRGTAICIKIELNNQLGIKSIEIGAVFCIRLFAIFAIFNHLDGGNFIRFFFLVNGKEKEMTDF